MTDYLSLALERGSGEGETVSDTEVEEMFFPEGRYGSAQGQGDSLEEVALKVSCAQGESPRANKLPGAYATNVPPARLLNAAVSIRPPLGTPPPATKEGPLRWPLFGNTPELFSGKEIVPHGLLRNAAGARGKVRKTDRAIAPEGLKGKGPRARAEGQDWVLASEGGQGPGELPLLTAVRRARTGAAFVREGERHIAVTLPESAGGETGGLTAQGLDRTVERDARRYDGGFTLW